MDTELYESTINDISVDLNRDISDEKEILNMYGRLIKPLKEFENTCRQKEQAIRNISEANETINSAISTPIAYSIGMTIALAIPFDIIFWIITFLIKNSEGVRYSHIFFMWEDKTWIMKLIAKITPIPEDANLFVGFIVGGVAVIVCLLMEIVILPPVYVLLPILFVLSVIYTVHEVRSAKKNLPIFQKSLAYLTDRIPLMEEQLSYCISIVPPDYRNSDAVEFFYKSYINHKAATVKEAVLLYDQHCHMRKVEENQQQMLKKQNEILKEINAQNAGLDEVNSRLQSIEWNTFWA